MVRLFVTIGLFLSLIILARGMIITLDTAPLKNVEDYQKQKRSRPAAIVKPIQFYPPPPPVLPDLNSNYLFNEERSIAGNLTEEGPSGEQEIAVNIRDVFYVGSVITDEYHKGIVAYPVSKTPPTAAPRGRRLPAAAPVESGMEQVFLTIGDNLGGYKVTEVEPDRIVFKKGTEVIEKMLNDPDKKRKAVAPQPLRANSPSKVTTIAPPTPPPASPTRNVSPRPTPAARRQPQAASRPQSTQPSRTPRAVRMTEEQIRQMEQEINQAERQKR